MVLFACQLPNALRMYSNERSDAMASTTWIEKNPSSTTENGFEWCEGTSHAHGKVVALTRCMTSRLTCVQSSRTCPRYSEGNHPF